MSDQHPSLALRFRGFLPVVIDVETGGFNSQTDALLEIAAVLIEMDAQGNLRPSTRIQFHVDPFPGANLEQAALDFTGIDPSNPLRGAVSEETALKGVFEPVRKAVKQHGCTRAVLVGHNSFFDQGFLNAATDRTDINVLPGSVSSSETGTHKQAGYSASGAVNSAWSASLSLNTLSR